MDLLEKIKEAGIIGAGGAGFPTHIKLKSNANYILLNSAECEPLLRVDQQLLEFKTKEVIKGFYMASELVGATKAIIGIKNKHKKVIDIIEKTIEDLKLQNKVFVGQLPDVYPAGDEQVLVYELTGRVVPENGIPLAVDCIVINTETALNIYNASINESVCDKYVTISGDVPNPITVKVPIGTPVEILYKIAGRENLEGYEVIDGGPMMGNLFSNKYGYVTRKTKGLIVLEENHKLVQNKKRTLKGSTIINRTACEQCRMCTDLCPRYLLGHSTSPHKMVRSLGFNKEATKDNTVALTCCQCNLCDYFSCPAGISPKLANVYYMNKLREQGIKHISTTNEFKPRDMREYRMVPSKRLIERLNIKKYDNKATLNIVDIQPEIVGISLNDYIGKKATPIVQVGDYVNRNDKIADIEDGSMGAVVHSSISGVVEEIREDIIIVRRS